MKKEENFGSEDLEDETLWSILFQRTNEIELVGIFIMRNTLHLKEEETESFANSNRAKDSVSEKIVEE